MKIDHFDIVDKPEWRPLAVMLNASAAGGSICGDLRNSEDRHPEIFQLASATVLNAYHIKNDGPVFNGSPALTGTFGAGAGCVFMPSFGPRGTIATGATTSKFTLTTALPATVAAMQLSGRGDGVGFKVRIIDNGAGGSGKTEERYVVANTAGTTPLITVDTPFSFTPVSGSAYEFLSGKVFMLSAGTLAAGIWKWFDVLTNSFSGNLATTNLPATIGTDSELICLDELYVPATKNPGDGFLGNLIATAISATSITGQASGGDASVLINEYRNFQIRIIEDTVNKTAVGQRRKITSHTAGVSPVYTVPTWTVTPSANAKFVIENANEILLFSSASANTHTYAPFAIGAMTADTWNTTTYGARGGAVGAGVMAVQSFGITPDADKNVRHSHIYSFRGGNVVTLDMLDIAGGANGLWSNAMAYGSGPLFTTGSSIAYDAVTNGGKFAYINLNGTQNCYRFNCVTRQLNEWTQIRYAQGTAVVGNKLVCYPAIDPAITTDKMSFLTMLRNTGAELFEMLIER
jgi:hypothetical protein